MKNEKKKWVEKYEKKKRTNKIVEHLLQVNKNVIWLYERISNKNNGQQMLA